MKIISSSSSAIMRLARAITFAVLALAMTGCDEGNLRGDVSKSIDGKTYFAVIDDNGGHCGPMKLDGEFWPHAIGEVAEIRPGRHTLECGAPISFEVPSGVIFKFNYWGP